MRDFEILFDHSEHSELLDPVFSKYGKLGFPNPPKDRPWIYANFVQTLDGIVSLLGPDPSGGDIAQSAEDRWLMDLLRAHASAVIMGMNTLRVEQRAERPRPRGPVFRIVEPTLIQLRQKLHRGPERNIFVTSSGDINLADFAAFDGDKVEPFLVLTERSALKLSPQLDSRPHIKTIIAGDDDFVDLPVAIRRLHDEYGIRYLLCEGGPKFYGAMLKAGLIDEKFLTVAPVEAGQLVPFIQRREGEPITRPTVFAGEGFTKQELAHWRWMSCRKIDNHQFNRYRRIP